MSNDIFQRRELKYLISEEQRESLEEALHEYMIPDPHGESTICNIYYDTPDFRLIRHSLEKPVYKEKLRLRSYGTAEYDGKVFLELKKKYKGVVYKRRISLTDSEAEEYLSGEADLPFDCQIGREIDYFMRFYENLMPAVYLSYERTAYFSNTDPDLRITFDRNILWRTVDLDLKVPSYGDPLLDEGQSLMEIKAAKAMPLWLVELLSKGEIRQTSFSKYGKAYMTLLQSKVYERRGIYCV